MADGGRGGSLSWDALEARLRKGTPIDKNDRLLPFLLLCYSCFSYASNISSNSLQILHSICSSTPELSQDITVIAGPHLGRSQPHLPSSTALVSMRIYPQFVASPFTLQAPVHLLIRSPAPRKQKTCSCI
jgi:hypothetical protein